MMRHIQLLVTGLGDTDGTGLGGEITLGVGTVVSLGLICNGEVSNH